jgi:hypothetical protein
LLPAEQGKSLAKSPADGIFGKDNVALIAWAITAFGGAVKLARSVFNTPAAAG